jgi:hypothetical protein
MRSAQVPATASGLQHSFSDPSSFSSPEAALTLGSGLKMIIETLGAP